MGCKLRDALALCGLNTTDFPGGFKLKSQRCKYDMKYNPTSVSNPIRREGDLIVACPLGQLAQQFMVNLVEMTSKKFHATLRLLA